MKNKNNTPSSEFEYKDKCPSCGSFCNIHIDLDDNDECNECRNQIDVLELGQIIPKEEPKQEIPNPINNIREKVEELRKQETLEEAAEKYDENDPNDEYGKSYRAFIEGAKWQQEQEKITTDDAYNEGFENGKHWQQEKSYSGEEVLEILNHHTSYLQTFIYQYIDRQDMEVNEKWFKQFSKLKNG